MKKNLCLGAKTGRTNGIASKFRIAAIGRIGGRNMRFASPLWATRFVATALRATGSVGCLLGWREKGARAAYCIRNCSGDLV